MASAPGDPPPPPAGQRTEGALHVSFAVESGGGAASDSPSALMRSKSALAYQSRRHRQPDLVRAKLRDKEEDIPVDAELMMDVDGIDPATMGGHKMIGSPLPIEVDLGFFTPHAYKLLPTGDYDYTMASYALSQLVTTEDLLRDIFDGDIELPAKGEMPIGGVPRDEATTPAAVAAAAAAAPADEEDRLTHEERRQIRDIRARSLHSLCAKIPSLRIEALDFADSDDPAAPPFCARQSEAAVATETDDGSDSDTDASPVDGGADTEAAIAAAAKQCADEAQRAASRLDNTGALLSIEPADGKSPVLLAVHPLELARQLTLLTAALTTAIPPDEVASVLAGRDTPRLDALREHEAAIEHWIAFELASQTELQTRALLLNRIVLTAVRCATLHNYADCSAILRALRSAPIRRLVLTWQSISARRRQDFARLRTLVSRGGDSAAMRETLVIVDATTPAAPRLLPRDTLLTPLRRTGPGGGAAALPAVILDLERMRAPYQLRPHPDVQTFITERTAAAARDAPDAAALIALSKAAECDNDGL